MADGDSNILLSGNDNLEGIPSYLGVHQTLPTQVAVNDSRYEWHHPISSVENSPTIHFRVASSDTEVLDLYNSRLYIETKILDQNGNEIAEFEADGTTPKTDNECLMINGLNTSLFKNVEVKYNNKTVTSSAQMYHYRGDIENRLLTSVNEKEGTEMGLGGYLNEPIPFESTTDATLDFANPQNEGVHQNLKKRYLMQRGSQSYFTFGRIHSELFEQVKKIPPRTVVDLVLEKNDDNILLLTHKGPNKHRVVIKKCMLMMHYMQVDEDILMDMRRLTETGIDMKFPVRRVHMSYYTKNAANSDLSEPNLFKAGTPLPRRVFIGLVAQTAFRGNIEQDPFNYQDFGAKEVCLLVGGQSKPAVPLRMGRNKWDYHLPLDSLQRACQVDGSFEENGITLENYRHRNFIMGWDLTASGLPTADSYEMKRVEAVDLVYLLKNTLPHAVSMVVYAEYGAEMHVDKFGEATMKPDAL